MIPSSKLLCTSHFEKFAVKVARKRTILIIFYRVIIMVCVVKVLLQSILNVVRTVSLQKKFVASIMVNKIFVIKYEIYYGKVLNYRLLRIYQIFLNVSLNLRIFQVSEY